MKRPLAGTLIGLLCLTLFACLSTTNVAVSSPVSHFASASPSVWNQTYRTAYEDQAKSVIQTSDGGYAVAGSTRAFDSPWSDFWLIKADSSGTTQWNKTYGGSGEQAGEAVIQTSDGGYALAGHTWNNFMLIKTDETGNMQWSKVYAGTEQSEAYSIIQTADGGYVLAGDINHQAHESGKVWLVKTDAQGNMEWNKTLGEGQMDIARAVIATNDGGYALIGSTSLGAGGGDILLIKTDSAGNMRWSQTYGTVDQDAGYSVVQAFDGGYVLGGWLWSHVNGNGTNIALIKTDSLGNLQWNRTFGQGMAW
jgi:hypothetical protein